MFLSSRIKNVNESITLKLNEKAQKRAESGKQVFNLTAGQLPFRPQQYFLDCIDSEMKFLKSFQYSPVAGTSILRKKIIDYTSLSRNIDLKKYNMDCFISNGGKQAIYMALGALIDPGDEVILLAPYWISYPEMVKFWGGVPLTVEGQRYNSYIPHISDIEKLISARTKLIIINSPSNPTGVYYPADWMKDFACLMEKNKNLCVLSDEIYYELAYFDPAPTYFYQYNEDLLDRTLIIDGISKSMAATGLRIGYCMAKKELIEAMSKLQGQTTSGANSLVQMALVQYDFKQIKDFIDPVKLHLRHNAEMIRKKFYQRGLESCWYQINSAFYYFIDFTKAPVFARYAKGTAQEESSEQDYATKICEDLLDNFSIACVPGSDFGMKNSARISIVLEEAAFELALERLCDFLSDKKLT